MQSVVFVPDITQETEVTWRIDDLYQSTTSTMTNFRFFAFEYDASEVVNLHNILSFDRLAQHAENLLKEIKSQNLGTPIFVAHGYGGLICERVRYSIDAFNPISLYRTSLLISGPRLTRLTASSAGSSHSEHPISAPDSRNGPCYQRRN